jgi:hypothetical protein
VCCGGVCLRYGGGGGAGSGCSTVRDTIWVKVGVSVYEYAAQLASSTECMGFGTA